MDYFFINMKLNSKLNPTTFFRTRNYIPVEELDPINCENCGYESKGHFCPSCGQEVAEFNRPFGFILYDFVGNFFAFDTRFFRTFKYLLIRPGFLTGEFFKGRRMRYSPPFRIFVFLSFVLFLLLQIVTERSLDFESNQQISEPTFNASVNVVIDDNLIRMSPDSVKQILTEEVDTLEKVFPALTDTVDPDFKFDITEVFFTKGKLRDKLNKLAELLEGKLKRTTDTKDRTKLQSYIAMCRNPEIVISTIMKYLSWSFFILLPLFALILKLFYIRRKQNYIRHLIFSIHLHSFLFFILTIIVTLRLVFTSGVTVVNAVLLISFPVYFILALRHFYGQNYLKVVLKFLGISVIYNLMLWSVVAFVFLKSIQII
jgi:hypothetical protein